MPKLYKFFFPLALLFVLLTNSAMARSKMPDLETLVKGSDTIILATVLSAQMFDDTGEALLQTEARTGQGEGNYVVLTLKVSETLKSRDCAPPKFLSFSPPQTWHTTLSSWSDMVGEIYIFHLKGTNYEPAHRATFTTPKSEVVKVRNLLK